ncbi:unnamed protein product, partial [Didymodactylos carnosus]
MTSNDDDFESITRLFDTNALLHCPICERDFNDPRILCSNGHTFCHDCIKNSLQEDGIIKCPICHDTKRLASVHDISQLPKNYTVVTLKNAEHHRLAQLGICELCNKKMSYGRCYHCRKMACFKCMHDHERSIENEQEKEYKQEHILNARIDDLYLNHSTSSHEKLQKLKHDVEKDSQELEKINPKKWNSTDRFRLTKHWNDIQRKLDDQHVEFTYKSIATINNRLGEIHLKQHNQDMTQARVPRQQLVRIDPNVFNIKDESNRDQLSREAANLLLHRGAVIHNGQMRHSAAAKGGKLNT